MEVNLNIMGIETNNDSALDESFVDNELCLVDLTTECLRVEYS
jgi:hypothetical protein